jgi:spermidine/putrescine ABC transporter ATP-binding subunit
MANLVLRDLTKDFPGTRAVESLNLRVKDGVSLALLGPSGCGKTTTLRMIAGLEQPTAGEILVDGNRVKEQPPYRRDIGMVFQNYALFPHLNVFENIAFGLRRRGLKGAEVTQRVDEALRMVRLAELGRRLPRQLSGGQQQRVALVRALVIKPKLLLLDEPLGALDKKLRLQMQVELRQLQRELKITTIFVTHDQEEALALADEIAVMDQGRLVQVDSPRQVYERPNSRFVSTFIGQANFFDGRVVESRTGAAAVSFAGTTAELLAKESVRAGEAVTVAVRPERIEVAAEPRSAPWISLAGTLVHTSYMGNQNYYVVRLVTGQEVTVTEQNRLGRSALTDGQVVFLNWERESTLVLTR